MTKLGIEEIFSESQKERIHRSAVTLLEKLGFLCNHPRMLEAFREAGCKLGDELAKPERARVVKFTEEIVTVALSKSPSQFTLHPIAPGYREVKFGNEEVYFGTNASDMIWDLETDELRGTVLPDFVTGSRLIDACENIDAIFGFPCYWMYDVARKEEYEKFGYIGALMAGVTMLHCGKAQNRVYFASTEQELMDTLQLWQITAGGKEAFRKKPCGSINVCVTSPYSLLGGSGVRGEPVDWCVWTVAAAEAGVVIRIEGSGLLGLSAPVTVAGAITQDVAEFLALNVAIQTINPGNPVVISEYTGSADLSTGSKAAPRPEAMLVRLGIRSMAEYYNKPSGWYIQSDAVMADSQAAWEHMGVYLLAALAGVDLTMSGGGLCSADIVSFRQILIDNEMIGWVKHLVNGFDVSDETIPLDLMMEIGFGPLGNHFLGTNHTGKFYKSAMWRRSSLTNALLRDAWIERGKKTLGERALERARELLKKHKPHIPEGVQKEIREYLFQVLEREGVKDDEAKKIMDKTYWRE